MNKKTYKQPSLKVVELDINDLICVSPGDPATFSIIEDEVYDSPQGSTPQGIWGKQW